MFLDILDPIFLVSQPLSGVLSAKPLDDVDGSFCDVARKVDLVDAAQNDVVNLHWVAGSEGWPDQTKNMRRDI